MHRAGFGAAALLASWMAAQATAEAQIMVTVRAFEGRSAGTFDLADLANRDASPITLAECERTITFAFTQIDPSRDHLSFFEGTMCDVVAERQNLMTDTCNKLDVPDEPKPTSATMIDDVDILVSDLLPDDCAAGAGGGIQNVWVLALNNDGDEVNLPGQQTMFPLAFDFSPPSTPGSLQATGGENVATLSWGSGDADAKYQVFLDPTGCDAAGNLISDGPLTTDPPTLSPQRDLATGGMTTVPFPDSVPFDTFVAVAIRAIDDSGNLGALSNVVCVERFETTSWWDSRCGSGDGGGTGDELCRDDGGTCAATPGRPSGASLGALLLIALAALVIRRRAR